MRSQKNPDPISLVFLKVIGHKQIDSQTDKQSIYIDFWNYLSADHIFLNNVFWLNSSTFWFPPAECSSVPRWPFQWRHLPTWFHFFHRTNQTYPGELWNPKIKIILDENMISFSTCWRIIFAQKPLNCLPKKDQTVQVYTNSQLEAPYTKSSKFWI